MSLPLTGKRYFNPRSPHGERRGVSIGSLAMQLISIHAPRTGSDGNTSAESGVIPNFNPRSPHGERRVLLAHETQEEAISIHAPRTGSDTNLNNTKADMVISIHAPRTGSDGMVIYDAKFADVFQSTLPARGATADCGIGRFVAVNFNPRSPHGERRHYRRAEGNSKSISIHAPRTGSDRKANGNVTDLPYFNPRSPHGERRRQYQLLSERAYFNPRSPHGERPSQRLLKRSRRSLFQSTLPARGATVRAVRAFRCCPYFNPRSPHGERQDAIPSVTGEKDFNPRSPHGERPVHRV